MTGCFAPDLERHSRRFPTARSAVATSGTFRDPDRRSGVVAAPHSSPRKPPVFSGRRRTQRVRRHQRNAATQHTMTIATRL